MKGIHIENNEDFSPGRGDRFHIPGQIAQGMGCAGLYPGLQQHAQPAKGPPTGSNATVGCIPGMQRCGSCFQGL